MIKIQEATFDKTESNTNILKEQNDIWIHPNFIGLIIIIEQKCMIPNTEIQRPITLIQTILGKNHFTLESPENITAKIIAYEKKVRK